MLTKFAKPYEKSHEKNLNCFERYDALFEIKNNFQILVLGTPEGYPALDPFNFIKVDSKFGIMTQSNGYIWVYMCIYRYIWDYMGRYGYLWVDMGIYGYDDDIFP